MAAPTFPPPASPVRSLSGWGATSLSLGLLGLFFSWVSPLGFILSLSGLISGIVGWVLAGRSQGRGYRLAVGGTVLSAFALGLNFFLTAGGFVRWVHQMFLP